MEYIIVAGLELYKLLFGQKGKLRAGSGRDFEIVHIGR